MRKLTRLAGMVLCLGCIASIGGGAGVFSAPETAMAVCSAEGQNCGVVFGACCDGLQCVVPPGGVGICAKPVGAGGPGDPARNLFRPKQGLTLIEPIDPNVHQLPNLPGIEIFFLYFNLVWPWLLGSAAGFAVLQALIGGIQIMISGGKDMREQGQTRLMWALAGLLMIAFAGFILRTLNPLFYT